MNKFKLTLVSAFFLLNKNWPVYLVSYFLFVLPVVYSSLIGKSTLLSVFSMIVGVAWLGTKTALLRDSKINGHADWTRLKMYLWKYFKKFSPLIFVYMLLGFILLIVGVAFWIKFASSHNIDARSKEALSASIEQLLLQSSKTEFDGIRGWLFSLPFYLLFPFTNCFAPVVVIKEVSFFKGILKTIDFLIKHQQLYFSILLLTLFNSLLIKIILNILAIPMTLLITTLIYQVIFGLLSTYTNLLVTAFVVVYITNE